MAVPRGGIGQRDFHAVLSAAAQIPHNQPIGLLRQLRVALGCVGKRAVDDISRSGLSQQQQT